MLSLSSGLPCWVGRLETREIDAPLGIKPDTAGALLPACLVGWVGLKLVAAAVARRQEKKFGTFFRPALLGGSA